MKGPADKFLIFLPEYLFVTISVTLSDLPPKANPADSTFVFLLAYLCHYQCHSNKASPAAGMSYLHAATHLCVVSVTDQ